MVIKAILIILCSLGITILSGLIFIPIQRKIKAGQPVYKYVETHKSKNGTPTMGGLFFIVPSAIIYFIFCGFSYRLANFSIAIGLAFMFVGFLDDFLKIRRKDNEGLKPYQKIIFQILIGLFAGFFALNNGVTLFFVPFSNISVDLGVGTVIIVAVVLIAITNSVNLTDGLDGLAGSVSATYLVCLVGVILLQINNLSSVYAMVEEYENLIFLSVTLIGGILGFLLFNTSKASVFMGDTGSLSLGGFIGAISIFSSNGFLMPFIGIMFVITSISVIIQVLHFKRTKKRIFLMAPLHHHFQLKGVSESKIAFVYSLITFVFGVLVMIPYV